MNNPFFAMLCFPVRICRSVFQRKGWSSAKYVSGDSKDALQSSNNNGVLEHYQGVVYEGFLAGRHT